MEFLLRFLRFIAFMKESALFWHPFGCTDVLHLSRGSTNGLGKYPGREKNLTVTHGDDFSTGSWRASPISTRGYTPVRKTAMPHRLKEAKTAFFCKATWKYYDCVRKSFHSFWQAQPARQGSIVCPVQRGGNPRGETCSYQRADKWYELWSLCLSFSLQCA